MGGQRNRDVPGVLGPAERSPGRAHVPSEQGTPVRHSHLAEACAEPLAAFDVQRPQLGAPARARIRTRVYGLGNQIGVGHFRDRLDSLGPEFEGGHRPLPAVFAQFLRQYRLAYRAQCRRCEGVRTLGRRWCATRQRNRGYRGRGLLQEGSA